MGFLLWDVAPCHSYANKGIPTPHPTIVHLKSPWIRVAGSLANECESRVRDSHSLADR